MNSRRNSAREPAPFLGMASATRGVGRRSGAARPSWITLGSGLRKGLVSLFALLLLTGRGVAAEDSRAVFDNAARLYEQGYYAKAAAVYESLLTNGVVTAAILHNQGNAWLREGRLGRAIACYRQALRLEPRDPEIASNLRFARSKVIGAPPPPGNPATRMLNWLRPGEWIGAAFAATWLCCLTLIARELWPRLRAPTRGLTTVLVTAALVLTAAASISAFQHRKPHAVAIAEGTARFGPLEESQSAFTLPDGSELDIIDRKDTWLRVRDAAGRTGWLPATKVLSVGAGRVETDAPGS